MSVGLSRRVASFICGAYREGHGCGSKFTEMPSTETVFAEALFRMLLKGGLNDATRQIQKFVAVR